MFVQSHSFRLVASAVLLLPFFGCSDSTNMAPKTILVSESSKKTEEQAKETKPNTDKQSVVKPKEASSKLAQAYTPPYPERLNPFQPPMNAPRVRTDNKQDSNSSVTLVGFANVGEPKVVLTIDGVVSPMSNGEEIAGVQVISIAPPNAVLQRGRNRWTASLTN